MVCRYTRGLIISATAFVNKPGALASLLESSPFATVAPSPLDEAPRVEFCAYIYYPSGIEVSLRLTAADGKGISGWVKEGESFEGTVFESFDPVSQRVRVRCDGSVRIIGLKSTLVQAVSFDDTGTASLEAVIPQKPIEIEPTNHRHTD